MEKREYCIVLLLFPQRFAGWEKNNIDKVVVIKLWNLPEMEKFYFSG
jgi:hypothetical protein